jgi:hypothetical protein
MISNKMPEMIGLMSILLCVAVSFAQPAPGPLVDRLRDDMGEAYIAARSEALTLDALAFEQLRAELLAPAALPSDRIIGRALSVRRDSPPLAAEFDQVLAEVLANPVGARAGDRYDTIRFRRPDQAFDPLVFEMMLKYDHLPFHLRWGEQPGIATGTRYATAVDAYLGLLEIENAPLKYLCEGLSVNAAAHPDPRVGPAMGQVYRKLRVLHPIKFDQTASVADMMAGVGGVEVRDELESLVDFERDLMLAQGRAPWDDVQAEERRWAAVTAANAARAQARRTSQPLAPEDEALLEQQLESSYTAWSHRMRWLALTEALAKVNAELAAGGGS